MKALVCRQFGPLDDLQLAESCVVDAWRLAPVISERIRLEDAVQGLQRLARREVRGKVVVTFKDTGLPAR
ncbi:hypothetical protein [Neopusillimonas aromaticivorans]|jgi:hypothetical protein|uniref:hypothetical protein n=1 Tax=Neopusillimonas aromaticivorans TaxID=2979868 RepID=UPI0025946779|nr:hypothetical protein [Neopusillimonas aromaticivorans]NLZ11969.1 hypothetical protein [Alcaligenaceae bacterium]WJJ94076.1 hypothetical protein N7E01_02595 [Neopusillimonas aromaticivorans]